MSELEECKDAATKLGTTYFGSFDLKERPAGCYYLAFNNSIEIEVELFFNLADPSDILNIAPNAGGVCKKGMSEKM